MSEAIPGIARQLGADHPIAAREPGLRLRTAIVVDHNSAAPLVKLAGEDTQQHVFALSPGWGCYAGQRVWVLQDEQNLLILGPTGDGNDTRAGPAAWVYRTSNLAVPNATVTKVTWDVAGRNSGPAGGEVWRGANTSTFYPIVMGFWLVTWSLQWSATTAAGIYDTWLEVDTDAVRVGKTRVIKPATSAAEPVVMNAAAVFRVSNESQDVFRIGVWQVTGASQSIVPANSWATGAGAIWLGPSL